MKRLCGPLIGSGTGGTFMMAPAKAEAVSAAALLASIFAQVLLVLLVKAHTDGSVSSRRSTKPCILIVLSARRRNSGAPHTAAEE
eukprot:CAMPEP_0171108822 /NCGR_PEP_ID=MMETSP0766_2-20121228/69692_1 /TAXON_ID=439317 /ORGANISM="Gambierdiscus australes, Strain CAWD 149" /LENGTH=84 /DNA_ID=CAMNT_0011570431 /DNA_START=350 /DNA_END=605 /DNA_ORIENTATION=-